MSTNMKKFLIPVAAALAAYTGMAKGTPSNFESTTYPINPTNKLSSQLINDIQKDLNPGDALVTVQRGSELHNLILKRSADGTMLAGHYSHSSHSSHRSHYSSR